LEHNEFIELVEKRAEDKMLKTGKLEGSHYAAMKEIQKELNESVPAETVVGQVSASSANGEFCGNCTYLSCTESEQNSSPDKKGDIHFCYLFKSIIFHRGQHPNLPKLDGCKIIGKR